MEVIWEPFKPSLFISLSLMKLWVAPESNKILTGVSLIENVPVSTEAPAGMSLVVVKFSLPRRTCTIGFYERALIRWQRVMPLEMLWFTNVFQVGVRN
jgi:hypothetical protein